MSTVYTISNVQASLFGGAYPYFDSSLESKGLGIWDFNNDGNVGPLDLSIYEIALMLYEDFESRSEALDRYNENFNADIIAGTSTFQWSSLSDAQKTSILTGLAPDGYKNSVNYGFLAPGKRPSYIKDGFIVPSSFQDQLTGSIVNGVTRIYSTKNNINRIFNEIKGKDLTVTGLNGGSSFNLDQEGAQTIWKIISEQMSIKFSGRDKNVSSFYEFNDIDSAHFPTFKISGYTQSPPFSLFNINGIVSEIVKINFPSPNKAEKRIIDNASLANFSTYEFFRENFIFNISDGIAEKVQKFKDFATFIYKYPKYFKAVDYTRFLNDVTAIPVPLSHASYAPADIGSGTAQEGYALDVNNNATKFIAHLDIAYFRHNIENILIPSIRKKIEKVIELAINKGTTTIVSIGSIDFGSKEIADLTSAICEGNDSYLKDRYKLTSDEISDNSLYFVANAAGGERYYSDRKIIEKPVWKLIKCHTNEEYYVYENEFYDYSISGLFHISNIQGTRSEIPPSDNLFLNQQYDGVFAGIYYLKNFTDEELSDDYSDNYYLEPKNIFHQNWPAIRDQAKLYFYEHQTGDSNGNPIPHVPVGCYKIYLGIYPTLSDGVTKDESRILSYQSLPHYWESADCSLPPCYVPVSETQTPSPTITPSLTQTPSISATPTQTHTNTATNTPTNTQTNTPTQTLTQTATPTQTNTSTKTPTKTPTHTPSQTKTQTPSLSQNETPSATPSYSVTRTQTRTPTTTRSEIPPRDCIDSSDWQPQKTRTQTPTPSCTKTQTPTNYPCSKTPTPTQTPSSTPKPTSTFSPTPSKTLSYTPSQTKSMTPSPTEGFSYDQGISNIS